MILHLKEGTQSSGCHFQGRIQLKELAGLLKEYPFEEEVLENAKIHRKNMEQGVMPFTVTLRLEPECSYTQETDGAFQFSFDTLEIRDGKSKAAAVLQLEEELLDGIVEAHVFLTTKEQMEKLERNQL